MSQSEDSDHVDVSTTPQTEDVRLPLRPLAPKARSLSRTPYRLPTSSTISRPTLTLDGRCEVCFSRTCSLFSHRLHCQRRTRLLGITPQRPAGAPDNALLSSYALEIGGWFTEGKVISTAEWTYDLPISEELDQVEMRQLFRNCELLSHIRCDFLTIL